MAEVMTTPGQGVAQPVRGLHKVQRSRPFHCTFCLHSRNNYYRKRSVSNVIEELSLLHSTYGIRNFAISDELFGLDKKWVSRFCKAIDQQAFRFTGACQMRVTDAQPEVLAKVKQAGFLIVSMGFESASNNVLRSMKKKITVRQYCL